MGGREELGGPRNGRAALRTTGGALEWTPLRMRAAPAGQAPRSHNTTPAPEQSRTELDRGQRGALGPSLSALFPSPSLFDFSPPTSPLPLRGCHCLV